jgi:hypothetical protein
LFGDFKAAPDIRQSGPAAGGRYVLRIYRKVKMREKLAFLQPAAASKACIAI